MSKYTQAPSKTKLDRIVQAFNGGRYAEAEGLAREVVRKFPLHAHGWKLLGAIQHKLGLAGEALLSKRKAVDLDRRDFTAHYNLGNALREAGRLEEAASCYRQAIALKADFAEAHCNLATTLQDLGRIQDAIASFRKAIAIRQDIPDAYCNLSNLLRDMGDTPAAAELCRHAIALSPRYAEAHNNLGNALSDLGQLYEAVASYRQALLIKPDLVMALSNLGTALRDLGRYGEAAACYQQAMARRPDFTEAFSNLLLMQCSAANRHPVEDLDEAKKYNALLSRRETDDPGWLCERQPQKLRIGLVSGDLSMHPVGYFLESLLRALDVSSLELLAYPASPRADAQTDRLRSLCTSWKPIFRMTDGHAAELIRSDAPHVLIDLSGHTQFNRLPVFARRPAPVQVTWLGYFATTGVTEIDYLLGDPCVTPDHEAHHFTERAWRLPETYLCFMPPHEAGEVTDLPALANGHVTFGCFNNLNKMNEAVVALWSQVLAALPDARLFLKTKQLSDPHIMAETIRRFAAHGIGAERLILEGHSSRSVLMSSYARVDIALDPFPYPGGTTTAEALWMGVPVLTRRGDRFLSHVGETFAHNAGQSDWIADNEEDFVRKAVQFASDTVALARLRKALRAQVASSPLFDARRFAKHFEQAMWDMWRAWDKGDAARQAAFVRA